VIPKGNQRGGGQQLATHLLNAFDNERVEVAEMRGAIAPDLHGAFTEWQAQSKPTECRKYLYSMSVNPDHRQREFSREDYLEFVDRAEKKLGLTGQPRAVVFHEKNGREHCHCVWSRIDTEKMKAVQMSHDRQKLRTVAQDYARDHGLILPDSMTRNRGIERYKDRFTREDLHEKQQQERTGVSKAERRKAITDAWRNSDSAGSFVKALESRGYYLAQGDRRAYVVVDLFGEIHSLSRQIDGGSSKEVQARLAEFPIDKLPPAKKAQAHARQQRDSRLKEKFNVAQTPTLTQRRQNHQKIQARRRVALNAKRDEMVFRHHSERSALRQLQLAENRGAKDARTQQPSKGILAFLSRVTGFKLLRDFQQRRQDQQRTERHREQLALLDAKHDRERQEIGRQARALTQLETREQLSLQTALARAEFMALARPQRETEKQTDTGTESGSLSEAFRLRAAQKEAQKSKEKGRGRDPGRERDR
jgi:hypothetical protein